MHTAHGIWGKIIWGVLISNPERCGGAGLNSVYPLSPSWMSGLGPWGKRYSHLTSLVCLCKETVLWLHGILHPTPCVCIVCCMARMPRPRIQVIQVPWFDAQPDWVLDLLALWILASNIWFLWFNSRVPEHRFCVCYRRWFSATS